MGDVLAAAGDQSRASSATDIAVEADRVTKVFGAGDDRVVALDRVSVTIGQNEFFTLLGPSGCGKTTLLRLIAGFEHPSEGLIFLHGEDISALPPFKRPVNTVFQNYALFPHLTVAQNIGFGLEMLDRPKAEIERTVIEMLHLVRMEDLAGRRTTQLSGGQQQRVALARALAPRPKVLLLDEPLSALDLKLRKDMQIELKRLQNETGITFVFVTHDQEEALTMSDRLAVMSQGRILQIGAPRDIYDHPAERFVANFIGETNVLDAEFLGESDGAAQVKLASGTVLPASLPAEAPAAGKVNIMIRPEHAGIGRTLDTAALTGRLETLVYFGTDTHYHLRLADGGSFIVRQQNTRDSGPAFEAGEELGIVVGDNAVQVLRD